jgi:rod shape-determining protein MreD
MSKLVKPAIAVFGALLCQVTVLPAYLADPFKPNLLLIVVVWLGLSTPLMWGAFLAYLLGLVQDSWSGLYLGLNGFCYLLVSLVLHNISHRLYADSRYLMTLAVFIATIACGLMHLLLLALFSSAGGILISILASILPQALVNALVASLVFGYLAASPAEGEA